MKDSRAFKTGWVFEAHGQGSEYPDIERDILLWTWTAGASRLNDQRALPRLRDLQHDDL